MYKWAVLEISVYQSIALLSTHRHQQVVTIETSMYFYSTPVGNPLPVELRHRLLIDTPLLALQ